MRKLTINVDHIDPRSGDQFGFEIINNGVPLTFTDGGVTTSSYQKTFVDDDIVVSNIERIALVNTALAISDVLKDLNGNVLAIETRPDGKIVIGGDFTTYDNEVSERIIILNPDYTVYRRYPLGQGANAVVRAVKSLPNNVVVFGGDFTTFNGVLTNRLAQINPLGNFVASFTNTIMAAGQAPGFSASVTAIEVDGLNLYIGGAFLAALNTSVKRIISLNFSGSINSNFNSGTGFSQIVDKILNVSGGLIVVGAFLSYKGVTTNRAVKINTSGTALINFTVGFNARVLTVAETSTGLLYFGGDFTTYNGNAVGRVVRTLSTGVFDGNVFGLGFTTGGDYVLDIKIKPNGTFVFVGKLTELNESPVFNNVFTDLTTHTSLEFNNIIFVANAKSNDVILGGAFTQFQEGGVATQTLTTIPLADDILVNFGVGVNSSGIIYDSIIHNDKLYIVGSFTSYDDIGANRIISLNLDGTINTDFLYGTGFNSDIMTIEIHNDKLYVGGFFTSYDGVEANRIISLNLDGTRNTAFVMGSGVTGSLTSVRNITVHNDKLYVGGSFTSYDGIGANRIISLNLDGTRNTAFLYGTGFNSAVLKIEIYNDKLYVGGSFTSYDGLGANRIISLNLDGTINTAFLYGTGFDNEISDIEIIEIEIYNDKLYVGGYFTSYDGIGANRIISLNLDGTINTAFVMGSGIPNLFIFVRNITVYNDKLYIIGGPWTLYNNISVPRGIFLLNTDGTLANSLVNLQQTVQNTFDNFMLFHDLASLTHSIDGNVVTVEYEFEDEQIVLQSVYDTPDHVEITSINESLLITDIVDEIVVRSPHFIKANETDFDSVTFDIRIFEGNLFDADTFPILYSKTKQKVNNLQDTIFINVSNLCKEDLEFSANEFLNQDLLIAKPLSPNVSKWVKVNYETFLADVSVATYVKNLYVTDGYLNPIEEQNLPQILMTGDKRYINRNQIQRVYFQANRLISATQVKNFQENLPITFNIDITQNTNFIQSFRVDLTGVNKLVRYLFLYEDVFGGEFQKVVTFEVYDECKYPVNSLVYKNKWGVAESLPVTKKVIRQLEKESQKFNRSIVDFNGNFNNTRHTTKQFNSTGKIKYTINTNFLPEYMNTAIEEMFFSEEIWLLTENNEMIPITLDNTSQTFKTSNNDGLIQYTFEVTESHNRVKNIL